MNSIAKSFRKELSYQVAKQKPINAKIRNKNSRYLVSFTHKFSYHSLNPVFKDYIFTLIHVRRTCILSFNAIFILLIFLATLLYSQSVYK
jgi:hypothetical protein